MNRKLVTSGLLAGLLAGSGAGLILQSTGSAGAASPAVVVTDDSVTDDATNDDATTDDATTDDATTDDATTDDATTDDATVRPDRAARLTEVLQPLVDDGTITAEQLDAIVATLDAAGPLGGRGDGHHGRGDRGDRGDRGGRGPGAEAVAEVLGLTTDEVRAQLRAGQTLAEIAAAQGVEVQDVVDALVAEAQEHLAEHVAAGDLTQADADEKLAEITERITDMVTNGGGFGRGGRGPGADAAGDAAGDA